ncbi:DNA topoisomerase I [Bacillus sp. AFS098217]|uniref:type IA DNA topoisomerase n=1 Tax=Bacillus sp. AFS098217 TaxID=2033868 RepID=UPI000BEC2687|nr:type IA DNA topoisomerase [Bacillus sp. AFS098217]PEB54552.1 DNA topoisomerase I [Bacillus sp. AFS098217]
MGKTLFITEKPKVANEIMKSPRFRNAKKYAGSKPYYGYYENEQYIVSWCRGHLLELKNPEEMDSKYKEFRLEHLPLMYQPAYKVKQENAEQLQILVKLLQRPDVDHVVNICDADKEGELIYREVYEYSKIDKKQSRVFKSSYEASELEAALNRLESATKYDGLANAAKARQYLDYLLGMNITRGCTVKLAKNKFLLSSGRVQMCLLHEIRQRELAIENYTEQSYFNLKLLTDMGLAPTMKNEEQILNPAPLQSLGERLKGQHLTVTEFKESTRKKKPKLLYNLTDLYKDAHAQLHINAETARKHIQTLYEEGFITYPRSSSRHLPTEQVERVKSVMHALANSTFRSLVQLVDISSINSKHTTFNDELVTSHFAIIPTKKLYPSEERLEVEKQLYNLIVKRFIGNFMRPAVYLVREAQFVDPVGNIYAIKENILQEKGFLYVFHDEIEEGSVETFTIPALQKGRTLQIRHFELMESKTKKPALHTESSILTFMETAGRKIDDEHLKELMKGKRIGTVATEATFIPTLLERNYISIEKGKISTTPIGRTFVEQFPIEQIKNPLYTAEMEGMIHKIEHNEIGYEEFVAKTNLFVKEIVNHLVQIEETVADHMLQTWKKQIEICQCICGNGKILDRGNFFGCSNHPTCSIGLPKKIKEKTIPEAQVKKLFEEHKTDIIKGFKSNGREFAAYFEIKDGAIRLALPTNEELSLGVCPKCQKGHIINRKTFFGCTEYESGCQFMLPAKIKEKTIPEAQVKKLFEEHRTDVIKGFKSNGKEFAAYLEIKEGAIQFALPTNEELSLGVCPKCQKGHVTNRKTFFGCTEYENGCQFMLPAKIKGKTIPDGQIKKLLQNNTTGFINGFKGEKGEFTAAIRLKSDFSIVFEFPTTEDRTIGKCPLCQGRVIIGKTNYLCEHYKNGCDFLVSGTILGKKISGGQMKKLLDKNITDKIQGFTSSKKGTKFDARISYDTQKKRIDFIYDKCKK